MSAVSQLNAFRTRALLDQLYAPGSREIAIGLADLGESLLGSAIDLQRDPTPDRCDTLSSRLIGATALVGKLRAALIRESEPQPPRAA